MARNKIFYGLLKGSVLYSAGAAVARLIAFLSTPIFLTYLSAEQFGVQSIALLNEQVLIIFTGYAITNATGKYYTDARESGQQGTIVGSAMFGLMVLGCACGILWQLFAPEISRLTLDDSAVSIAITRLSGVSFVANMFFTLATNIWQLDRKIVAFIGGTLIKSILTVLLALPLIIWWSAGSLGVVLGLTLASVLAGLFSIIWLVRNYKLHLDAGILKQMLLYGWPLVPAAFATLILNGFDRYLLKQVLGLEVVGVYAVMFSLASGLSQLTVIPFKQIWVSFMWQMHNKPEEKEFHKRTLTYYVLIQIIVLCGLIVFGDLAVYFLSRGRGEFVAVALSASIVYFGFLLNGTYDITSAGIFFEGKTYFYTIMVLVSSGISVLINIFLIPALGLWACAIAYLVSYAVFAGLSYLFGRRLFKVDYEWRRITKLLIAGCLTGFVGVFVRQIGNWYGVALAALSVFACFPTILLASSFFTSDELIAIRRTLGRYATKHL